MIPVIGRTVAENLGVYVGAALPGVVLFLKDQDAGPLGENESVPVSVERSRCGRGVVIAKAQRSGGAK